MPKLTPACTSLAAKTVKDTVKDAIKSVTEAATGSRDADSSKATSEESELMKAKNDIMIEDAQIISCKLMIKTAELLGKQGGNDAIMSTLKQTLQEEDRMSEWLMDNSSSILGYHWSKIEAMIRGKSEEQVRRKKGVFFHYCNNSVKNGKRIVNERGEQRAQSSLHY